MGKFAVVTSMKHMRYLRQCQHTGRPLPFTLQGLLTSNLVVIFFSPDFGNNHGFLSAPALSRGGPPRVPGAGASPQRPRGSGRGSPAPAEPQRQRRRPAELRSSAGASPGRLLLATDPRTFDEEELVLGGRGAPGAPGQGRPQPRVQRSRRGALRGVPHGPAGGGGDG